MFGFFKKSKKIGAVTAPLKDDEPTVATPAKDYQQENQKLRKYLANHIYEKTNMVADNMNKVVANLSQFTERKQKSLQSVMNLKGDLDGTMEDLSKSMAIIKQLEESTSNLSNLKPIINDQSSDLKNLVTRIQSINEIGGHVKLLSFNASLEASRAGDAGKSFMVVADEIQKLSDQTKIYLSEMDVALDSFSSKNSIMNESVSQFVNEEISAVGDTATILERVLDDVRGLVVVLEQFMNEGKEQVGELHKLQDENAKRVENLNYEMSKLIDDTLGTKVVDLKPAEVINRLGSYNIIDVRRPDEFTGELSHINGANLITISDDFKTRLKHLPKDEIFLFVCRSGGRSARAARIAQLTGFKNVYNLEGGMLAWNSKHLPVARLSKAI
ncbi:rhodanese-like domain-containing protein [Pseudobacteriovorax antillogorgiicola]|uniref:Rhodanese-related sulfurtransferase n=1 Tax=Pseudobacteriovorax antillogorgiicola TaxID=1513793 RepID=A0A1Y6CDL6_9BACT|nr:rhodanese-like domain-containing protein [Pseudobacteriovorax antillogorgiicola]TCS47982.1 rhodanese-related sulfurtransferase [Pseudobacteriovorax antillogorgiicola]SMF58266.1 Rhodanese-related sulfurtransferase [Pseudobacteriovorax antillogorgiicola]